MPTSIAMLWDGRTPTADLIVNDLSLSGPPDVVQRMFNDLTKINKECTEMGWALQRVSSALNWAQAEVAAYKSVNPPPPL